MNLTNTKAKLDMYGKCKKSGLPEKTSDDKNISIPDWNNVVSKLGVALADIRRLYDTLYSALPEDLDTAFNTSESDTLNLEIIPRIATAKRECNKYVDDNYVNNANTSVSAISNKVAKRNSDASLEAEFPDVATDNTLVNFKTLNEFLKDLEDTLKESFNNACNTIREDFKPATEFFENYDKLDKALDTLKEIQDYLNGDGSATGGLIDRLRALESTLRKIIEGEGVEFKNTDDIVAAAYNNTKKKFNQFKVSDHPVVGDDGSTYHNTIVVTDSGGRMRAKNISEGMLQEHYTDPNAPYKDYLTNLGTVDTLLDTYKLKPYTERLDNLTSRVETLELNHVQYNSADFESVAKLPGNMKPDEAPILFLNRFGGNLSASRFSEARNLFSPTHVGSDNLTLTSSGSIVCDPESYVDSSVRIIIPTPGTYCLKYFGDGSLSYSFGDYPFGGKTITTTYGYDEEVIVSFTDLSDASELKFAIYPYGYDMKVFEPSNELVKNVPRRALTYSKDGTKVIEDRDLPAFFEDLEGLGMDVGNYKSYVDLDTKEYHYMAVKQVLNSFCSWTYLGTYDSFSVFKYHNPHRVKHLECNHYLPKPVKTISPEGVETSLSDLAKSERTNCIMYEPHAIADTSFYVVTNDFENLEFFTRYLDSMWGSNTPVELVEYRATDTVADVSSRLNLEDWYQFKDVFPMRCAQEGTLKLSSKVNSIDTANVWGTYTYLTTKEL